MIILLSLLSSIWSEECMDLLSEYAHIGRIWKEPLPSLFWPPLWISQDVVYVNGAISKLCDLRRTQLILYHYLLSLRLLPYLQENHTWHLFETTYTYRIVSTVVFPVGLSLDSVRKVLIIDIMVVLSSLLHWLCASSFIWVENQVSLGVGDTLTAKQGVEDFLWEEALVTVKRLWLKIFILSFSVPWKYSFFLSLYPAGLLIKHTPSNIFRSYKLLLPLLAVEDIDSLLLYCYNYFFFHR